MKNVFFIPGWWLDLQRKKKTELKQLSVKKPKIK
jgi:hypothetical protein